MNLMMVMAVVMTVVVGVMLTRSKSVCGFAVSGFLLHMVAFVLVAAFAHRAFDSIDLVPKDRLPLAQKWPLLAFLRLFNGAIMLGRGSLERGNHEASAGVF